MKQSQMVQSAIFYSSDTVLQGANGDVLLGGVTFS